MSSVFPNLSKIPKNVSTTINSRAGKNITASSLLVWLRVVSAVGGGLVLESFQNKKDPENSANPEKNWSTDTFSSRYGNGSKSGRVGTNFKGDSVFADDNDRAYRPSPVIEGISVQNGNKGLSRKCNFTIKCFTLGQAEKISQHFLEPGYTVLVEFGWNTSDGKSQKLDVLSACNMARYNNFPYVNDKRKKSNGHYDAFLGYITGGGIKSGDGETYECEVELTTLGEIPTYLQQHKGDSQEGDTTPKSDLKYKPSEINKSAKAGNVGESLFMQMFNRLPAEKQTDNVKALMNAEDYHGLKFSESFNFLNMDDELREIMVEKYSDLSVAVKNEKGQKESGKIPEGAPLFSDQSFIRLELAFKILNTCRYELLPQPASECTHIKEGFSFEIDITSTICRAFPNMFSTDPSILFIPNPEAPNFGLAEALTSEELKENFVQTDKFGRVSKTENINLASIWPPTKGDPLDYAFPARTKLSEDKYFETIKKIDSDILEADKGAKTWGYLRNLYINFEFFKETITRSNVVTKDIYYELLNGISSAVNSMWFFEILELPRCKQPSPSGALNMTVRDTSLIGKVKPGLLDGIDKFYTKGIKTPFLSSQLTFDIPGAMKNHVLGKRISSKVKLTDEGKQPEVKNLFAKESDPVIDILNSLKLKEQDKTPSTSTTDTQTEDEKADENRKKNYEIFIGQAGVFPGINDRENLKQAGDSLWNKLISRGKNASINEIAFVGAWKSSAIFSLIATNSELSEGSDVDPILLPIKFDFEVHGVSGIRIGDLFKLIDVPEKYTKGVFQVVETSHSIDGNQWKTNVRAQFRNVG